MNYREWAVLLWKSSLTNVFTAFLNRGLILPPLVSEYYSTNTATPVHCLLISFLPPCQQCTFLTSHLFPFLPSPTFCSHFFFFHLMQPPQHKCLCWEACIPYNPITVDTCWSLDEQIRVTWKPVRVPAVTSLSEQWREMLSGKPVHFVPVSLSSGVCGTIKYNQVEERLSGRSLFFQSWEMLSLSCVLFFFLSQNDLP